MMSNDASKIKSSRRRYLDTTAIAKQLRISRQYGINHPVYDAEPHRLSKHHAMDCGNTKCYLCGNPRRNPWAKKNRLTTQERKLFQDLDHTRETHSNGNSKKTTDRD